MNLHPLLSKFGFVVLLAAAGLTLLKALHFAFGPGALQAALLSLAFASMLIGQRRVFDRYATRTGKPKRKAAYWDLDKEDLFQFLPFGVGFFVLGLAAILVGGA